MRITYDPEANAAYIYLTDGKHQLETHVISESVNIDVTEDGTLYGIELLNANEQLNTDDGNLVIDNLVTGTKTRLKLTA